MSATKAPEIRGAQGYVFGLLLHLVLLLAVASMLVFLASRYRLRVDLTADSLFTLTPSTQRVLDRVDERLRIEAYFSPDDQLAAVNREGRRTLRNVLDEFVQQGRGRVVVQYLDPESDVELRKKAERLGIQAQRVQDLEGSTLSSKVVWQGLRFLYGGSKQKVVPLLGFSDQPWQYEAALTPIVKALTVAEKPRIGVIQWAGSPAQTPGMGRQEQPRGYGRLLGIPELTDRYEFVPVDLSLGQLVPDGLDTLVLLRPRDLGERQKYAFDQFLMGGGRLVVFADSDDVSLGQARLLTTQQVAWDAPGSPSKFVEQLAHYGALVRDRFLIDSGSPQVQFGFPMQMQAGGQVVNTLQVVPYYPYWYMPASLDWATKAEVFAQRPDGSVDDALVAAYREQFLPGVDPELAKGLTPPALFWPCAVDLAETLPDGVEGRVLMRSSPRSVLQTPPQMVDPVGRDGRRIQQSFAKFQNDIAQLLLSEPPRQHGLMIDLSGRFRSWFDGRDVPRRPGAEKAADELPDPLAEPVGTDPLKTEPPQEGEAGPEQVGPELGGTEAADPDTDKDADPATVLAAADGARLVVVADATFLRDDLIGGDYQQVGGPVSQLGPMFFANLLDWLAADRDLYELRLRGFGVDRRLKIVDEAERESIAPERLQQEIDRRTGRIRFWVVALPVAVLLGAGLVVMGLRYSRKRRFLVRTEA
jgi:hypothetical protein